MIRYKYMISNSSVKVSIIIPVYNVAEYLPRCLDSVTGQTLKEIEIIAVNDGSTDRSLSILENYAQQDNRILILNKENGGLSDARNYAFPHIHGEYVGFVDSDDWIDKEMYEQLYAIAKKENADQVRCGYISELGETSKEDCHQFGNTIINCSSCM